MVQKKTTMTANDSIQSDEVASSSDAMTATYDATDSASFAAPNKLMTGTYDAADSRSSGLQDTAITDTSNTSASSNSSSDASGALQSTAMTATYSVTGGSPASSSSSASTTMSAFHPYVCPKLLMEEHRIRKQWRGRCELEDQLELVEIRLQSLDAKVKRGSIRMALHYRSLANTERQTRQSIVERLCKSATQMNEALRVDEALVANIQLLAHRVAVGQIGMRDAMQCALDLRNCRLTMPRIWLRYKHVRPTRPDPVTSAEIAAYLRAERSAAIEMYVHLWLVARCERESAERVANLELWPAEKE